MLSSVTDGIEQQGRQRSVDCSSGAPPLREEVVRRQLTRVEKAAIRSLPPPIYTADGAFMKPWVMPHNRPPQARNYEMGASEMRVLSSTYRAGAWL
jgi:hypothetical protein